MKTNNTVLFGRELPKNTIGGFTQGTIGEYDFIRKQNQTVIENTGGMRNRTTFYRIV